MPDPGGRNEAVPRSAAGGLLATAGFLGVQRRWRTPSQQLGEEQHPSRPEGPSRSGGIPPVHLEDPEWSRAVLGLLGRSTGHGAFPAAILLRPERIDVLFAAFPPHAPAPFSPLGRHGYSLPRDSQLLSGRAGGPPLLTAARASALFSAWNLPHERCLLDIVACKSVVIDGPPVAVGTSLSDIVVELAARRWCDLDEVIVVGLGVPLTGVPGLRCLETPEQARCYLEECHSAGHDGIARCVVVSPLHHAGEEEAARRLVELVHALPATGVLLCGPTPITVRCRLRLIAHKSPEALVLSAASRLVVHPTAVTTAGSGDDLPREDASSSVFVRLLGPVAVEGAEVGHRPRALEILVYLALHPEGVSGDAIAAAVWPERRVPTQTLANRLSELRGMLGPASDGRPILRRHNLRHLLSETTTDWELFRSLSASTRREDRRRALALVRGRPFDGLADSGWSLLEGFVTEIEAAIVETACRVAEGELAAGDLVAAEAALRRALLVAPWDERLYRPLMQTHHAAGNRGGIDAALRTLARALDCPGDPLACVSAETAALYATLTRAG